MGKADSRNLVFEVEQQKLNAKIENFMDQNSNPDHGQYFLTPDPLKTSIQPLLLIGGVMSGPIGYNPSYITISDGEIDIGRDSGKYSGFIILTSESDTADILSNINNFELSYQRQTFQAAVGHTITITSTENIDLASSITLTNQASVVLFFDIITNTWKLEGGSGSGSSDVSFPITPSVNILGTVSIAQDIDLSLETAHTTSMTLEASLDITFSNYPTTGTQIEWELEITQDSTGGREITWPSELVNPPSLSTTADSVTVVVFRTNDGGTTVRVGNTVTTTAGVTTLSDLTIDATKDWAGFGITNLGGLAMTGDINFATSDGTNIDRLRFVSDSGAPSSTSDPSIFLDSSSNMVFNVNTLLDISFKALNVEIAKFTEAATGVYLLDMVDHYIDNIESTRYSEDQGAVTFSSLQPAIGYDSVDAQFKFNTPDLTEFQFTVNSVDIMQISNVSMTFQKNFQIICVPSLAGFAGLNVGGIAGDVLAPANGDIHYNSSTGTFRFYQAGSYIEIGGATSEFSDSEFRIQDNTDATKQIAFEASGITTATTRTITMPDSDTVLVLDTLANLGTTAINTDLLFAATGNDIGNTLFPVDDFYVEQTRFISGTIVTNRPMITSVGGSALNFNVPLLNTIQMSAGGISTHTFSPTSITTPNIIISGALTLNDSSTDPDANGQFTRNGSVVGLQADSFDVRRNSTVATGEPAEINIRKLADSITLGTTIGSINFQTGITTATTWADISAGTLVGSGDSDASFLQFLVRANDGLTNAVSIQGYDSDGDIQFLFGANDSVRLQPVLQPMGYFVTPQATDFLTNIGTGGTLEIPTIADSNPSLNDLSSGFGAFDGACGYESIDERFYIRESATRWVYFEAAGAVTS